jgi:hypothetical protein
MTLDAIAPLIVIVLLIAVIPHQLTCVFLHAVLHQTWQQTVPAQPQVNALLDSAMFLTTNAAHHVSKPRL